MVIYSFIFALLCLCLCQLGHSFIHLVPFDCLSTTITFLLLKFNLFSDLLATITIWIFWLQLLFCAIKVTHYYCTPSRLLGI